ncbi:protein Wnt-9a-like [Penaeus japonicus]|uniref:protein Wnt-9a-like n=1 Tax=Penaeus japonicus TaxID=27405 RepID=UPI001C715CFC|nr:protein Wnt-9a-like [Penaeus japonicus]
MNMNNSKLRQREFVLVLILATLWEDCLGVTGISSRRPLDQDLLINSISSLNLSITDLGKLCGRVGVDGRGWRMCTRSPEVAGVMLEAAWVSVVHCQRIMQYERWNCSLGHSRIMMVKKVYRETAMLQGLSAAALTHVVARACASGRLTRCSCDESTVTRTENMRVWRWGGCGDNLAYGTRFARRLFVGWTKKRKKTKNAKTSRRSRDFKSQIDAHNAYAGIKVVQEATKSACKCHGVSGSCTMQTCWPQLPSFTKTSLAIKSLYDSAVPADANNEVAGKKKRKRTRSRREVTGSLNSSASPDGPVDEEAAGPPPTSALQLSATHDVGRIPTARRRRKREPLNRTQTKPRRHRASRKRSRNDVRTRKTRKPKRMKSAFGDPRKFVYLDDSPSFCRRTKYGPGTQGRECLLGRNCESLCCGRGYDTLNKLVEEQCKCKVVLRYRVECHTCSKMTEVYTCK